VNAGDRRIEGSAVASLAPMLLILPVSLAALAVFWLVVRLVWDVSYTTFAIAYVASAVLLFLRPVQVALLAPLLGARRPTRDERARLDTAWRSVLQAAHVSDRRYVVVVLPSDELNAFACGGNLVVVTTTALETLPRDELAGVLAHELSHHLGFHTIALTVTQWLSVPVLALARIGFFLHNVAEAATTSFASNSSLLTAIGLLVGAMLRVAAWIFLSGLLLTNAVANLAGRFSEFEADERAIRLGFGQQLSNALRRTMSAGGGDRPRSWQERLNATHPPALTRVARIDAIRRNAHVDAG
jgi:Zn-dependent protease with chaperone function